MPKLTHKQIKNTTITLTGNVTGSGTVSADGTVSINTSVSYASNAAVAATAGSVTGGARINTVSMLPVFINVTNPPLTEPAEYIYNYTVSYDIGVNPIIAGLLESGSATIGNKVSWSGSTITINISINVGIINTPPTMTSKTVWYIY